MKAVAKWIGISNLPSLKTVVKQMLPAYKSFHSKLSYLFPDITSLELQVLWVNDINFNYFNEDFAGQNISEMQRMSMEFLSSPFFDLEEFSNWRFEFVKSIQGD